MNMQGKFLTYSLVLRFKLHSLFDLVSKREPQFYCSYFRIWQGHANRGRIETMAHTAL